MTPDDVLYALGVFSAFEVILRPDGDHVLAESHDGVLDIDLAIARRLHERGARWAGAELTPSGTAPVTAR